jgi:hypothetical protein
MKKDWRQLFRETAEILRPVDMAVLVATHVLFVFAEDLLAWAGLIAFGKFPSSIKARGKARATVILASGLQQTPFSAYPFGWFLAKALRFRVLLVQTPPQGNYEAFEAILERNGWIRDEVAEGPVIGIGFSKGGHDLAWIFSMLLYDKPALARRIALVMMCSPLRGSRMAKVVRTRGAEVLLPDTIEIRQTLRLVEGFATVGIPLKFYCAVWDRIVRRSDSRPPNVDGYRPPTFLESLRGIRRDPPWYWSQSLWLQFGHPAIYNPLAWFQVARHVSSLVPRL